MQQKVKSAHKINLICHCCNIEDINVSIQYSFSQHPSNSTNNHISHILHSKVQMLPFSYGQLPWSVLLVSSTYMKNTMMPKSSEFNTPNYVNFDPVPSPMMLLLCNRRQPNQRNNVYQGKQNRCEQLHSVT